MAPMAPIPTDTAGPETFSRIKPEAAVARIDSHDAHSLDSDASPPHHPVSALQGAFEESIMESSFPSPAKLREKLSAEARRRQMLELSEAEHEYSSRWTQHPGAKFHPLWKLVAQISFGIHLLHKQLAKSEDEVVRILQGHVDEVDSFAEDTTADFDLAIRDIKERIEYLLLPLDHSRTFNKMLCDRSFRASILDGNDIIERVIQRTRTAMERSLSDVSRGIEAVGELAKYLERLGNDWNNQDGELLDAYHVMRGNAEGWYRCFKRLQAKGANLADLMTRLESILDEVALRAGIASRRKTPTGVVGRKKRQEAAVSSHSLGPTKASATFVPTQRHVDKPLPPPPPSRHSTSISRSCIIPATPPNLQPVITSPASTVSPISPTSSQSPTSPALSKSTTSSPQKYEQPRSKQQRETSIEVEDLPSSSIVPTTLHVKARSPIGNTPKSATDSAYSSCAETSMLSSYKREQKSRPSSSTVDNALPTTSQPTKTQPKTVSDILHVPESPTHSKEIDQPIIALPTFQEPYTQIQKSRKTSLSMKNLFARKQSRKDMSGGVGGYVIVT